jgi:hypothetical protein
MEKVLRRFKEINIKEIARSLNLVFVRATGHIQGMRPERNSTWPLYASEKLSLWGSIDSTLNSHPDRFKFAVEMAIFYERFYTKQQFGTLGLSNWSFPALANSSKSLSEDTVPNET